MFANLLPMFYNFPESKIVFQNHALDVKELLAFVQILSKR